MIWRFYAQEDGQYRLIAETTWNDGNEPDVYRVDLDGDGVDELICNVAWAGCGQDFIVYRNRDGEIERGWWDWGYLLDDWAREGLTPAESLRFYDPERGFVLDAYCWDENEEKVHRTETAQGLEHFVFEPYDPAVIPLGVAPIADN